ncbi:MAG: GrpB family protein [Anaerolineales bacterium]|nr:GrpB family protein [Anaerolineales bacterium]
MPNPKPIGPHNHPGAVCIPYDPLAPEAAREVIRLIAARDSSLTVEHVGSTAVPGCDGKGVLDLLVMYEPGALERAKEALADLGFQRQTGRDPWPEDRPMRVGSLAFEGRLFPIHAHVIARGSDEASELMRFRDRLRADPELRNAYAARKREILKMGIADSLEYSIIKGSFVRDALEKITRG